MSELVITLIPICIMGLIVWRAVKMLLDEE